MAAAEPTIVIGKLDDKELQASIEKLVSDVADKSQEMAGKFESAMDKMKSSMKDFAITQKVSVDLMKEAWRDMSKSFDAMMKAQESASSKSAKEPEPIDPNTVRGLEKQIAQEITKRKGMYLDSDDLLEQNDLIAKLKQERKEQLMTEKELDEYYEKQNKKLEKQNAEQLKNSQKPLLKVFEETKTRPVKTLDEYEQKLHDLQRVQQSMRASGLFNQTQLNKNQQVIDNLKKKIDEIRNKQPKTLKEVLGMDESSVDAITRKMRELKRVQVSDPAQVNNLSSAYQRLTDKRREMLGQNQLLENSNLSLARSFNYIRNRLVYAFTIGAVVNFTKELVSVRAEYEMLDRSLGILIGDMEKGTQIFNQLNEMALKSPFTLIELGTAAKQLTAYNFTADEVVDTTRRLADISAALGVPMERLTYNLGQIKAQGVLNARDARDFANAGLAIVPMLAKLYTEQKRFGDEIVTTAQVYDMMSKKMVSYGDVLHVLTDITDEGGKFFDFQARQADTLKVQLANLTLAYNNMLNEIGTDNQGAISGALGMLRSLAQNWKTVKNAILTVVSALGAYKGAMVLAYLWSKRMAIDDAIGAFIKLAKEVKTAKDAMILFNMVCKANPLGILVSLLATAGVAFLAFGNDVEEASEDVEMFGENSAKTLGRIRTIQKILAGLDENTATYKSAMQELNGILNEYGITEISNREEINEKIKQTIALIGEEASARQYANQMAKGQEEYNKSIKDAKDELYSGLQDISFIGDTGTYVSDEIKKNLEQSASAISDVVAQVIESNIYKVVGKTGQEAEKGIQEINKEITKAMRNMGFSDAEIGVLLNLTNLVRNNIISTKAATEAQEKYNKQVSDYYEKAQKANKGVLSFNQKLQAQKKVMTDASSSAKTLYDRIYSIVDLAKKNSKNTITFDLQLTATNPPKWMKNFSDERIRELATNFGAIAAAGGRAKGMTREQTLQRSLEYASEYRLREEAKASQKDDKNTKTRTKQTDEFAKAIKKVGDAMTNTRKKQQELLKEGFDGTTILNNISENFGKTIELNNKKLQSFGVTGLKTATDFANMGQREQKSYLVSLLNVAKLRNSAEAIEYLEGKLGDLNDEILKTDNKTLIDSLNSELSRLKEEYEIGLELDANPELGGIIAQSLGLTDEQLQSIPRTAKDIAERAQKVFDEILGKDTFNFLDFTDKKAFEGAMGLLGIDPTSKKAKALDAYRVYYNKVLNDETKAQTDEWDKLLEKYAEYEYKQSQIQKKAVEERKDFAIKFGNDEQKKRAMQLKTQIGITTDPTQKQALIEQLKALVREIAGDDEAKLNIAVGINTKEAQESAKLAFEEFQKSPEWITATGDLAGLTDKALGDLIQSLEDYKDKASNLNPKQIKELNRALNTLYKQQRQGNPFKLIANYMDKAREQMRVYNEEITRVKGEIDKLNEKKEKQGHLSEEEDEKLKSLNQRYIQLKKNQKDVGEIDAKQVVESLQSMFDWASKCVQMFSQMADALMGDKWSESKEVLNDTMNTLQSGLQGAQLGASVGGPWGAAIGGAAGLVMGAISSFSDNSDKKIQAKIKDSEREVKKLENLYKDLQFAVEQAYGANVAGLKQAVIANKELQLAELKRQLALEQSRDSKHRDEDRIIELKGQIIDLRNEITKSSQEIVTELLGISSVGDAAMQFMDTYIEALRKGEDAQKAFGDSYKEMIANMIKQIFVTKVIAPQLEALVDDMNDKLKERSEKEAKAYQKAVEEQNRRNELSDEQVRETLSQQKFEEWKNDPKNKMELAKLRDYAVSYNVGQIGAGRVVWTGKLTAALNAAYKEVFESVTEEEIKAYRKEADKEVKRTKNELTKATTPTISDLDVIAQGGKDLLPLLQATDSQIKDLLDRYDLYDNDSETKLSALQQGISQISETTANSIEAYLNGVSQQVYYQSDILTQIRDTVQSFDIDVQTSTFAEMLLQLQISTQTQNAIRSIMEGWSSPNGMSVRVEMV